MKSASIWEITVIVVLAVVFIIYLIRKNVKDEEDNNPDLTNALKDAEKKKENNE